MQHQRTQIYLDPSQHAALVLEARKRGLSLAGIIRSLVEDHFQRNRMGSPGAQERKQAALSLVGLGKSGHTDISERADRYLAAAIHEGLMRERRSAYRRASRRRVR